MQIRRFILLVMLAIVPAGCFNAAHAQYYSWGNSPASIKWDRLETPAVKLIYPTTFQEEARRALWYFDTIRPYVSYGYRLGTMRTPVILHTENMVGNGMVMWAPKRIELLSAPGSTYSEPWLKQLVIHEYRHNVQYHNMDQSTMKVLGWILGDQIKFVSLALFGITSLEGDAVMFETEMSAFGRGLQPSFTMHYRAAGDVGDPRYANDYWFCGSFRDYVPDHYKIGYQTVRWGYHRYGDHIFDTLAWYSARNPYFFAPSAVALKKFYGTGRFRMFKDAFGELNALWDSLPQVDSSTKLPTPWISYTTYQWPQWLDDNTVIAFKKDFDRYNRIVEVDVRTGDEKRLAWTGSVSSRPVLSDGKLWWTEYRASTLWEERVNSQLCFYDVAEGKKGVRTDSRQIFYPAAIPGEGLAYAVYDYTGRYSIVQGLTAQEWEVDFPPGTEICGLAWDDETRKLYFIGLDDGGMFLGAVDREGATRLTSSRHITISDLQARGGKLYFGSIVSGKDEGHCYDLATGVEYRLTESAYGSFQPFPDISGRRIALTTYDKEGYKLAVQETSDAAVQEQRTLPVNLVNPDWRRWNLPKMDSLVFTPADLHASEAKYPQPKRFRKGLHLFDFHSWLPMDFYPMKAMQEMDFQVNLGATAMSQSLLSDAVTWLAYGWSGRNGSSVAGGFNYTGLGPVLDVEFMWGGANQAMYTPIPESLGIDIKKYFSVTTTLSVPMVLGSGYWYRVLTPAAEYFYTNGLIFRPYADQPRGVLTRGVTRLNMSLFYAQQTRMAQKELLPRWGFAVKTGYVMNPGDKDFRSLWNLYLRGYLPGVVRTHSTTVRAAWQQTAGNDSAPFVFNMKELFPRGALYDFRTQRWASGSIDYQFPVWYPENGIPSILYFKRIRLNVFADYGRWQDFSNVWRPLYSYGGDVILDVSPVRLPASTNVSLKFTFAKASNQPGLYFKFGIEVPL